MFNFLKEKISNWAKRIKEKAEKPEEIAEQPEEKIEKLKEEVKVKEEKKEKAEKIKEEREEAEEIKEKREVEIEKKVEKKEKLEKIKEIEEKEKIEEKEEEVEEKKGFFEKIAARFKTIKLDEQYFNEIFEELEFSLIENNVAIESIDEIKKSLKNELVGKEIARNKIEQEIKQGLKDAIEKILIEPFNLIEKIKEKRGVFVIVFFGINGSGKTTSIAKIAHLLIKNNISCIFAASDTFRAASIEQLYKHAEKLGIKVIRQDYGSDPAAVAFDAITHAQSHGIKVVLIDTAGRMHTKENLLKEMEKICRVARPDLKIFVGESIAGNDIIEQVKIFNNVIGIDGIILTKVDVDEKGGSSISVGYATQKPIIYLGTSQNYDGLEIFNKEKIIKGLGL